MVATPGLKTVPWWTIVTAAAAAAALMIPGAAELLIYDRSGLLRGEMWRLLTAHLVHYSGGHLLNNMLVLVFAGALVETRYRSDWPWIVALSSVAIGIGVYLFEPGIARYAGASGVAFALLTYAALRGLAENPRWRVVCALVLVTIALKLVAESLFGWQLVHWERQAGFVTVTLSHTVGATSGFLIWSAHGAKQVYANRFRAAPLIEP